MDAPCPDVKKENAFEDTLFLIDILRQTKAKENKEKKVAFTKFHIDTSSTKIILGGHD